MPLPSREVVIVESVRTGLAKAGDNQIGHGQTNQSTTGEQNSDSGQIAETIAPKPDRVGQILFLSSREQTRQKNVI